MAKTTAPLLGFDAGGTVGKTVVYAKWRGIPYTRRYTVPANPNSTEQQKTRGAFAMLSEMWKFLGTISVAPWNAFATGKPLTGRNKFIGDNTAALRPQTDCNDFIGSPGAGGGVPPSVMNATAGVGTITVNTTNPTAPTGWSIVALQAMAFPDQNPTDPFGGLVAEAQSTTTPWSTVQITGLTTVLHQVRAWLKWQKADGTFAYSVSLSDTATPT